MENRDRRMEKATSRLSISHHSNFTISDNNLGQVTNKVKITKKPGGITKLGNTPNKELTM
jgi:hypothetical protein